MFTLTSYTLTDVWEKRDEVEKQVKFPDRVHWEEKCTHRIEKQFHLNIT